MSKPASGNARRGSKKQLMVRVVALSLAGLMIVSVLLAALLSNVY